MSRRLVVAALAAVALLAGAGVLLTGPADPAKAVASPAAARSPVLSARRVPALVAGGAADVTLRHQLDTLMARAPAESCLDVTVGGRTVYEHNAEEPLTPASNEKLLTAATVLSLLDPDSRFTTSVVAAKSPKDGVVTGDLWLVGGGDPLLATKPYLMHFRDQPQVATSLESLADAVVAAGVKRIDGAVIGDESRYDTVRYVASWPSRFVTQNQTGPLSALTVDDDLTSWTTPEPLDGDPGATPAANPPQAAAAALADLLEARGVAIAQPPASGKAPLGATAVAHVDSPPLTQIVGEMLRESDNQTAEMLTKELGLQRGGAPSTAAGVAVITAELQRLGLPVAGTTRDDGSGLDASDKSTCRLFTAVLDRAGPRSPLADGLPVAARSGTLADRFENTPGAGRVRAKTGSLTDVTSLSGFVDTQPGATVAFSFLANGAPVSSSLLNLEESVANQLVTYPAGVDLAAAGPR